MSIEKFINRLKYGFYTIERIENIADQRIGLITHGLVCGLICNLLSIIGLKYMISLGAVPLCTIMVAALFLDLYIMYIIEKNILKTEPLKSIFRFSKKNRSSARCCGQYLHMHYGLYFLLIF